MAGESDWISWAEAARLTGIPVHVIEWWKRQGCIEHRPEDKMRPTLLRSSVEDFAHSYLARQDDLAAARQRRSTAIERRLRERSERDWMTLAEAALVIGCDPSTVSRYVRDGDLVSRHLHAKPSISRESVEAFAEDWRRSH